MRQQPVGAERTLRHGRGRLVGYFGQGGEGVASAFSAAQSSIPELHRTAERPSVSNSGLAAFGLAAPGDAVVKAMKPDGSFILLSGRIYADTTVDKVLDSWLDRGSDAFKDLYFHGLIAAWNVNTSAFVLVRDEFGVETGYYAETDHGVFFADDQNALLRLGADPTPNPVAIDAFLTDGYFPAPVTPFASISKIAAGGIVEFADGTAVARPLSHYEPSEFLTYEAALAKAPATLQLALERIWPTSGDVGLLLSGGIDSAMLVIGIKEMLGQPLHTFTFRYDEYDGQFNEGSAAKRVADHLSVPHDEIRITPQDLMNDLDAAVAAYGEPLTWGLHSYRLSPMADMGIQTVFSGAGADGGSPYKRIQAAIRFGRLPSPVRAVVRAGVRAARPLNLKIQAKAEFTTRQTSSLGGMFSPDTEYLRRLRGKLYRDPTVADRGSALMLSIFEENARGLDPGDPWKSLAVMGKHYGSTEAMCAWNRAFPREHGLAMRMPYYDPDLINRGLHIEGGATGKDLMREIAERYLPTDIAQMPKMPQQIPVSHWLRGSLGEDTRERLSELPAPMTEIFDPAGVIAMVDRHVSGRSDFGWQIISLLTLSSWFSQQTG